MPTQLINRANWQSLRDAQSYLEKAIVLDPEFVQAHVLLARTYFHLYEMARELDPVSIDILFGLARIQLARWEMDKALETFARIRQLDPASVNGFGYVADINMKTGDLVQGLEWIFKALAADPEDSDLSHYVVMLYLSFGDFDSARKWLRWIEHHQKFNPLFLSNMAILNINEGHPDSAMKYVREAIDAQVSDRHGSDAALARTLLIWALDQGQTANALEIIRQAHPELFETSPLVDAGNVSQAIDTAQC